MSESMQDPVFGDLTWDPTAECWEGVLELPERRNVSLTISVPENSAERAITEEVRQAFSLVLSQEERFKEKASQDLLAFHNDAWRRDGRVLTTEEFEERLTLESIRLFSWGSADVYFDDGDLFWGHLVLVEMETDGTFKYEAKFEV